MKTKIILLLLSMLASFSFVAQSKTRLGIKFNGGAYGVNNTDENQDLGNFFSIGLTSQSFLGSEEKISFGVDFLYNHTAFSTKMVPYSAFKPIGSYSMKNVLVPIKLNYHFKKATFTAGFINSIILEAKYQNDDVELKDGDLYQFGNEEVKLAYLDKKYDLQALLGASFTISNKFKIGVETSFYFSENEFKHRVNPQYFFYGKNMNFSSLSWTFMYFLN
ncbi:MAG TPA: hypothetical protein PKD51_09465 [Saprospiraceae bacterium]|nr:hypothetical protein [Saprospiraceae bacterium]